MVTFYPSSEMHPFILFYFLPALQVPFRHPSAMHETHGTVESAQQNSISGMREATTVVRTYFRLRQRG